MEVMEAEEVLKETEELLENRRVEIEIDSVDIDVELRHLLVTSMRQRTDVFFERRRYLEKAKVQQGMARALSLLGRERENPEDRGKWADDINGVLFENEDSLVKGLKSEAGKRTMRDNLIGVISALTFHRLLREADANVCPILTQILSTPEEDVIKKIDFKFEREGKITLIQLKSDSRGNISIEKITEAREYV